MSPSPPSQAVPPRAWTRDELLVVFNLYCRTPYGRLNMSNPDIIELARQLGRTTGSVGWKLNNFASFDPAQTNRDVKGAVNASRLDRQVWDEFHEDWSALAVESDRALQRLVPGFDLPDPIPPSGPSEVERTVKARRVQGFFRRSIYANYDGACAMCDLNIPALLNASHIINWSADEKRRADPTNGLLLCALHDRAFDRRLISVDQDYNVIVARSLKTANRPRLIEVGLIEIEGKPIRLPRKFHPDLLALAQHSEQVLAMR